MVKLETFAWTCPHVTLFCLNIDQNMYCEITWREICGLLHAHGCQWKHNTDVLSPCNLVCYCMYMCV